MADLIDAVVFARSINDAGIVFLSCYFRSTAYREVFSSIPIP